MAFKRRLAEQVGKRSGQKLSKATMHSTLTHLKRFFHWLAGQPGYKSHLQYSDADYFNLSEKDVRVAGARREQLTPTVEQIHHVVASMPADNDIQLRNRALVAFTLLTGARDGAIASLRLKHVNPVAGLVRQDARDVKTKFSKTFDTYFFPVGDNIRRIVVDWITHLRTTLHWGDDDPLFPATKVGLDDNHHFQAQGLERTMWQDAAPIRSIFRDAFKHAGLPHFPPHSFRRTLAALGQTRCRTPEHFKAWSQNLGHDGVLTTFLSYGSVAVSRQKEILRELTGF
jgi:integrase/recombinase XerD